MKGSILYTKEIERDLKDIKDMREKIEIMNTNHKMKKEDIKAVIVMEITENIDFYFFIKLLILNYLFFRS